jgi:hypothetical protein
MSYSPFSYTVAKKCHHVVIHSIYKNEIASITSKTHSIKRLNLISVSKYLITSKFKVQTNSKQQLLQFPKFPPHILFVSTYITFKKKKKKSTSYITVQMNSRKWLNLLLFPIYYSCTHTSFCFIYFQFVYHRLNKLKKNQLSLIAVYKNSLLTHLCLNIHHVSFIYSQFVYHSSEKL